MLLPSESDVKDAPGRPRRLVGVYGDVASAPRRAPNPTPRRNQALTQKLFGLRPNGARVGLVRFSPLPDAGERLLKRRDLLVVQVDEHLALDPGRHAHRVGYQLLAGGCEAHVQHSLVLGTGLTLQKPLALQGSNQS